MPNRALGRTMALATVTPVLAFTANCQPPFPRGEVFAGFSHANVRLGSQSGLFAPAGRNYYGAQFSAKFNLSKNVGLLFDWGEQSGASTIPDSCYEHFLPRLDPDSVRETGFSVIGFADRATFRL